jgi:hypothetical protein
MTLKISVDLKKFIVGVRERPRTGVGAGGGQQKTSFDIYQKGNHSDEWTYKNKRIEGVRLEGATA